MGYPTFVACNKALEHIHNIVFMVTKSELKDDDSTRVCFLLDRILDFFAFVLFLQDILSVNQMFLQLCC